jgi:hypothetical protein
MTEPTPFLHLTILADGRPVHCETVDVRGLAGARALERLVEGHHEVAQRFVAAGHRVQVRLADPDRLAGTAVIDMDASGVTGTQLVDVDPGVEAAWRAGALDRGRRVMGDQTTYRNRYLYRCTSCNALLSSDAALWRPGGILTHQLPDGTLCGPVIGEER